MNPPKSGTTGNFIITTQNSNGVDIDSNNAITGVVIIPGNLYRANEISTNPPLIEFSNLQIGTDASATLSFRTKNDIPGSGKFKIEFPTGFNVVDGIKILSTELGIGSLSLMDSVDSNNKIELYRLVHQLFPEILPSIFTLKTSDCQVQQVL